MVILEACLLAETMPISSYPPSPYFYLYLLLIKDMGVLFPISPFSMKVLRVLNVTPSQLFSKS